MELAVEMVNAILVLVSVTVPQTILEVHVQPLIKIVLITVMETDFVIERQEHVHVLLVL